MRNVPIGRRAFLGATLALPAAGAQTVHAPAGRLPICIFSKQLHWLSVPDAAALAAELGFDGLDLTVRPGGHVLPERVQDDLPKAIEAVRKTGLVTPMITTEILDPSTPHAEAIIRTAASLGIRRYRWGPFRYDYAKPLPAQIAELQKRSSDLAALNRQHGVCAMYHTHSGAGNVGASMWDLWMILRDLDNNAVSVNYDIAHGTIEGGLGGWGNSARLLLPLSKGVCLKDFYWEKGRAGNWAVRWCPTGDGMVNFSQFLRMVKSANFEGPIQAHMEYNELGGADQGRNKITIARTDFSRLVKRDLTFLRTALKEAGLT